MEYMEKFRKYILRRDEEEEVTLHARLSTFADGILHSRQNKEHNQSLFLVDTFCVQIYS